MTVRPAREATAMHTPSPADVERTHLYQLMRAKGFATYAEAHRWSVDCREEFWRETVARLNGKIAHHYSDRILDLSAGPEAAVWLPDARFNIALSCLEGDPDRPAIVTYRCNGMSETWTRGELEARVSRLTGALAGLGIGSGDAVAIDALMTAEIVAVYLAVIRIGAVVVSIADSFPAAEIAKRLRIANAKLVFTHDALPRGEKFIPLYERLVAAGAPQTVVLPLKERLSVELRPGDLAYANFLAIDGKESTAYGRPPYPMNILFSSGTTGDPKAIVWDHTTAIKCAADAYWHHDLHPGDVACWPTNLGWMMGPWLVFAGLINRCTIALYEGSPTERGFCEFVQNAGVTMLGLVPSIAKAWRASDAVKGLDWSKLRCFSSTGEASNPDDYAWLMRQGQPPGVSKPVIEYCGGTEIGGGYISNVLIEPNEPGVFNAKVMGSDFVVLNDDGSECQPGEIGEVFLKPPTLGLSTHLLNRDHHGVYYEGCPPGLRRHGDRMRVLSNGRYASDGRADDTMNLGGIKTSSAEIEAALRGVPGLRECAAVGVPPPGGGPDRLVLFAVLEGARDIDELRAECQRQVSANLNPLFRIAEVRAIEMLPRTASNKVMRRELRKAILPG